MVVRFGTGSDTLGRDIYGNICPFDVDLGVAPFYSHVVDNAYREANFASVRGMGRFCALRDRGCCESRCR